MKQPVFRTNPILIEGLPGLGFIATISACHLINELNAKKFAEIRSPAFRDLVVSTMESMAHPPIAELYSAHCEEKDLIILYGNTQALTTYGQYELCGKVLDITRNLKCKLVITLGGLRRKGVVGRRNTYCAATDIDTLNSLLKRGLPPIEGSITGIAGILLGLARIYGIKGFCILVETPNLHPDPAAAQIALEMLCKILGVKVSLDNLPKAVEKAKELLQYFKFAEKGFPTFL
jgi:hypothetical protein